ncbi:MAG: hypothetical protein PHG63_03140 [Candidatus Dojkabacteria bacterium]|nr:hypothetical protein [Candidatus Dojkabacteria bacterium]
MKRAVLPIIALVFYLFCVQTDLSAQGAVPESQVDATEEALTVQDVQDGDDSEDLGVPQKESVDSSRVEEVLDVEMYVGTQSVFNNTIPLYVRVLPKVSSTRAQISWHVPRGLVAEDPEELWFSMEEDVEQVFRIDVSPQSSGSYRIVVDVTAWRFDTNYVSSTDVSFVIDETLHISPAPADYVKNIMIYRIVTVILVVLAAAGLFFGAKFAIRRFKQWLSQD